MGAQLLIYRQLSLQEQQMRVFRMLQYIATKVQGVTIGSTRAHHIAEAEIAGVGIDE